MYEEGSRRDCVQRQSMMMVSMRLAGDIYENLAQGTSKSLRFSLTDFNL